MPSKFKVTNTTIKKPRINPRTGKDVRSAGDRVGHGVSIRMNVNEQIIIQPQRARLFDSLSEGMLRLRDGGFISIEEIGDVSDVLKNHVAGSKKNDVFAPDSAYTEGVKLDDKHPLADRKARAMPMGEDSYAQAGGREVEGAINPDGEPNFLVRADKNMKRKMRTTEEAHTAPEAPVAQ